MTFATMIFFIFLVIVFVVYWSFPNRKSQNLILVISSYIFYGWWDWRFCGMMLFTSTLDYFMGRVIERTASISMRKVYLSSLIVINLGILCTFKYLNFFAQSFSGLLNYFGWREDPFLIHVILPVGISFYTFQSLGYTIDVYRGKIKAVDSWIDYLCFISFFPQLVAGPIERAERLLSQFSRDRIFDKAHAVDGCRQFLWGLFKKIAIADNMAVLVDRVYSAPSEQTPLVLILGTVAFAIQIYTDFSAYSDMAIGCAKFFGISLMRNFALPYFSQDPVEFWRRWHISLSTWFKDYVYFPLGGSHVPPWRRCLNVIITFTLSGLWHGASMNFIIWGFLNGLMVFPFMIFGKNHLTLRDKPAGESLIPSPIIILRITLTFALINITWIFFRAPTLNEALLILKSISTGWWQQGYWSLSGLYLPEWPRIVIGCSLLFGLEWFTRGYQHPLEFPGKLGLGFRPLRWAFYTFLLWLSLGLSQPVTSTFIYFQF